ncbi:methyltransferase [Paroceanicella profunda]|uniref:Methyltransferase n=1 Tax=Paroceanicella profunda TaxID=2579971 RepID=A0A5B8FU58_9RHOB|nr:methyltransferase [Paroceanicella profunda]QDL90630.1 methyltransferase [Paroceanicella profunda]
MTEALTRDAFLDGRLMLWQPRDGYRAATDPVLLAAAVPAVAGARVLDLGCGVGAAGLCLATRVPGLEVHGLELQPLYADLARRNAAEAGLELTLHDGDLADPPASLRTLSFDHVISNPPYFAPGSPAASDPGRDRANRESATPLALWVDAALRRLRPGGRLTFIQRAERLPEILGALGTRAGHACVLPVTAREGRAAGRVIVTARKGGRGPFRLLAPLVMHDGARHLRDGADFSAAALAVLRDAAPLDLPESDAARR